MERKANNLISEKSPYLLQHAYNPVKWYPWSNEVFIKARRDDKPVFLSIGYSTCHWCHVMERESFEDAEVAELMNEIFYSVKVDREERPDIDKIYMKYCQLLTGSGGWPLTIIMTPDKKPFFAATYIPKYNKYGKMGMLELIPRIKDLWSNKRGEIIKSSGNITRHFLSQEISAAGDELDKSIFDQTFDRLFKLFDNTNGGFGTFPKFPSMQHLYFLLRYWKRTNNEYALRMVEKTIRAMRSGGIWDHIGFGFHRYSTDEKWIIPHFEKMLYDQALISIACIEAFQATRDKIYKEIAGDIFTYILRDMTSTEGGFYSAQDADSEGVEGKFYTWTTAGINKMFPEKESELIIDFFSIGRSSLDSGSVLYNEKSMADIAQKYNIPIKDLNNILTKARKKMFSEREKRIHPFKDDKILTDWNGLMVHAMAMGARTFDNNSYYFAAKAAADFIISNLTEKDGSLLHRYRDSQSAIPANLDDYAFFIMGLLGLYETSFNIKYLETAIRLNAYLMENFWDNKNGGFYFTKEGNDLSNLRQKDIYDGSLPSGNSIAILNLIKLARITADTSLEDKARKALGAFSGIVKKAPEAYTQFISSADFILGPSFEIVLVGDIRLKETKKIFTSLNKTFIPNKIFLLKVSRSKEPGISNIALYTENMHTINNKPTIYICSGYSCKLPTNNIGKALELLNAT
ncbi:MAG: thioredoxin domain-containing protein [Actinobacteria bacterium]|nr:thioredoxin domain-containing protein [Actinomycetota bacterium]